MAKSYRTLKARTERLKREKSELKWNIVIILVSLVLVVTMTYLVTFWF